MQVFKQENFLESLNAANDKLECGVGPYAIDLDDLRCLLMVMTHDGSCLLLFS